MNPTLSLSLSLSFSRPLVLSRSLGVYLFVEKSEHSSDFCFVTQMDKSNSCFTNDHTRTQPLTVCLEKEQRTRKKLTNNRQ